MLLSSVAACDMRVVAEVFAEGQMATLLQPADFTQVNVKGVGPGGGAMEERIGGVVGMRDVRVAERNQRHDVWLQGSEGRNGDLNVDDGLCSEPRHRRRTHMIHPECVGAQSLAKSRGLGFELIGPARVVRHNSDWVDNSQD